MDIWWLFTGHPGHNNNAHGLNDLAFCWTWNNIKKCCAYIDQLKRSMHKHYILRGAMAMAMEEWSLCKFAHDWDVVRSNQIGVAAIAQWICLHLHPAAPGLSPKHTICTFINLFFELCCLEKTKINKKRDQDRPILKIKDLKVLAKNIFMWHAYRSSSIDRTNA